MRAVSSPLDCRCCSVKLTGEPASGSGAVCGRLFQTAMTVGLEAPPALLVEAAACVQLRPAAAYSSIVAAFQCSCRGRDLLVGMVVPLRMETALLRLCSANLFLTGELLPCRPVCGRGCWRTSSGELLEALM